MEEQLIGLRVHPLVEHAERELKAIGSNPEEQGYKHLMEIVKLFASQEHTAETARIVGSMFYQLSQWQPISPLLGIESEWEVVSKTVWVNVRCRRVFREIGVGCYDVEGIVFVDDKDRVFTKQPQSRVRVTFPYVPDTKYVRVRSQSIIVPNRSH